MRRAMMALVLLLAGCDGAGAEADGYDFVTAEYRRDQVITMVVTHESLPLLQRAAKAHGAVVEAGRELQAFALLSRDRSICTICTIHIVDPVRRWQPEWLGHEMAHCLYGRWHA